MADIKLGTNANGDHAVGVEVEGVFIPVASVPAHRIEQMRERNADLLAKAEAGDEEAQKVLDNDYTTGSRKAASESKKGGDS